MNLCKFICLIFAIALHFAGAEHAQSQEWITIAEKTVNFKTETDVITPKGKEQKIDKLRIKCIQGTLTLKMVRVEMSDGQKKEYDAKGTGVLTKGLTSLSWDLPGKGGEPKVKKIELEYDAVGNVLLTKKAKVEVQGKLVEN